MKKLLFTVALLAACQFDTSEPIETPVSAPAAPPTLTDEVADDECTTPDHAALPPPEVAADPRVRLGAAKALPALAAPAWTPPPVAADVLAAQERYDREAASLATRLAGDDLAAALRDRKEHLLGSM